jgi:iron complex transport system substrate-binding protein
MAINRIVSFLPSATELIYELGEQERIFGVTHECDFPKDARTKPRVIESVFESEKMSSKEINEKILDLVTNDNEIYKLQIDNLKKANPDLIISQEICEVCSAYTNQVNNAMEILGTKPEIFVMNPHNIEGILSNVDEISRKIGVVEKGVKLVNSLKKKIRYFEKKQISNKPRVLAIEWIDPFYTSGHWIPEMIELVGAKNLISKRSEHSREMTFDEIKNADPDIIIMMPCGFDVQRTITEYDKTLKNNQDWQDIRAVKSKKVFAVDANSYFSKPSIRIITGIEVLGKIIHPEEFSKIQVPNGSFRKIN